MNKRLENTVVPLPVSSTKDLEILSSTSSFSYFLCCLKSFSVLLYQLIWYLIRVDRLISSTLMRLSYYPCKTVNHDTCNDNMAWRHGFTVSVVIKMQLAAMTVLHPIPYEDDEGAGDEVTLSLLPGYPQQRITEVSHSLSRTSCFVKIKLLLRQQSYIPFWANV